MKVWSTDFIFISKNWACAIISRLHEAVAPPSVLDSGGQTVVPATQTDFGRLTIYDVPTGQDGEIWSFDKAAAPKGYPLQLLNAPNLFSLWPETLLIPADAPAP